VDRVVQGLGLDVPSIDTRVDAEARKAHRNRTGRNTVPCLYIDDVPLFESADIIDWLEAYAQAVSLD
jgi:glutathione S-transferase